MQLFKAIMIFIFAFSPEVSWSTRVSNQQISREQELAKNYDHRSEMKRRSDAKLEEMVRNILVAYVICSPFLLWIIFKKRKFFQRGGKDAWAAFSLPPLSLTAMLIIIFLEQIGLKKKDH